VAVHDYTSIVAKLQELAAGKSHKISIDKKKINQKLFEALAEAKFEIEE
jgi:hypothetical protein